MCSSVKPEGKKERREGKKRKVEREREEERKVTSQRRTLKTLDSREDGQKNGTERIMRFELRTSNETLHSTLTSSCHGNQGKWFDGNQKYGGERAAFRPCPLGCGRRCQLF